MHIQAQNHRTVTITMTEQEAEFFQAIFSKPLAHTVPQNETQEIRQFREVTADSIRQAMAQLDQSMLPQQLLPQENQTNAS